MSHAALVGAFCRVLELSRLEPGQTAVIVTDGPMPGPHLAAAQEAFAALGMPARLALLGAEREDRERTSA